VDQFVRWSKVADETRNDIYNMHLIDVNNMSTSSVKAYVSGIDNIFGVNEEFFRLNQQPDLYVYETDARDDYYGGWGRATVNPNIKTGDVSIDTTTDSSANVVDTKGAFFVDMIENNAIKDGGDMKDLMQSVADGGKNYGSYKIAMVFNDNEANNNYRDVAMIVILDADTMVVPKAMTTVTLNLGTETLTINGTPYTNGDTIRIEKGTSVTVTLATLNNDEYTVFSTSSGVAAAVTEANKLTITVAANAANTGSVTVTDSAIDKVEVTLAATADCTKFFKNDRLFTGHEEVVKPTGDGEVELVYELEVKEGFSDLQVVAAPDTGVTTWIRNSKLYVVLDSTANSTTVTVSGTEAPKSVDVKLNGVTQQILNNKKVSELSTVSTDDFILKKVDGGTVSASDKM